jgi:hypothetical protein
MSYESVDVYVVDQFGKPVEGVLVRVFDSFNINFQTQDTTDADGRVGFTLFTAEYNLRFFRFGAQVPQPQVITVIPQPAGQPQVNVFDVSAVVFVHPVSNDPRLCRASGYFRDITGAPEPGVDIHVIAQFEPIVLEGSAVLSERRAIRTDKHGFACVDLIRCAKYTVLVQGFEDSHREIEVPDTPSVNLPDLLFPVVEEVILDPLGPYSLLVGGSLELTPVVLGSNMVPLQGTARSDMQWSSSDETVLTVQATATTVLLAGKAVGSAEIQGVRRNNTIVRIPNTPIQGLPQTVIVS